MTKSLMSNKELLLAVVPDGEGSAVVRYASVSGRRILDTGVGVPARLVGPLRVSVFSLDSYFEQAELAAASAKMLPLVARRHVDTELVFDESYRLRARSRAKRERTISADIAAVSELDLDLATSLVPIQQQPCLQMVPVELAIAALVSNVTSDPVIVFWERGGVLLSILVVDGMVQARMRERVRDDNREVILGRAEASLRSSTNRLGEHQEVFQTLYTGDLRDLELEDLEGEADRILEDKLSRFYRAGKHIPGDAVLRDPELYGLPFVAEDWSFIESDYRKQVQAWRYAKPVAALAAVVGVAFALVGGFQQLMALSTASDFDDQRDSLHETLSEIERIRPSDEAMASVRSGLQVQLQSLNEVRLDRMLGWLTHMVPDKVVIRALEVEPVQAPRQSGGVAAVKYAPGQKPFAVKMEIVLPETTLDAAEASAAEVVRRLSQRLKMVDSRLDVPAPEPGVRRNVVLMVNAEARAVSF